MKALHVLTDEMISLSQEMFLKDHHWMAYNCHCYELGEGDLYFFRNKPEAKEFAENNFGDFDSYKIIYASSIMDLISQVSTGNSIGYNKIDDSLKTGFMNEENLNDLKNSLKTLGFGDKLYPNLEHHIRQGFPEFVLKMNFGFGRSKLDATLFFSRSIEKDHYFFYRYDAKLKNDVGAITQSFDVKDGQGVTLKEAFNLLEGRAVYKEMNPNEAGNFKGWLQLDFNTKGEDGNYKMIKFDQREDYDLKSNLSNLPLKELSDPLKAERLILSLQKGNLQPVTISLDGKKQKFSIQANPLHREVDVYDYGAIRPLSKEQKAELVIEARQKLNGKEVTTSGAQQGKEMKQDDEVKQINYNKTNFMNEKNFDYLKDNLKYLGFGDQLSEELQKNLSEGKQSFQLKYATEVNHKPFEAMLQFRKSENSDLYFLNNYQASLERSNGQRMAQTFYLDNGKGVTAREAYNLLEGRAVFKELENKEGQKYSAWQQLDFSNRDKRGNYEVKQFHEHYGYDLKAALSRFAVSELSNPEKEKSLLRSLEKGNIQSVSIEKEGFSHKMYVEANPQFKSVNLYDAQFKRVQKDSMHLYTAQEKSETKEVKQDQKEVKKGEPKNNEKEEPKKSRSAKNGAERNLLPQKEGNPTKGLRA